MRLRTIWTIQGMSTRVRLYESADWLARELAARLPKRLKYWTVVQGIARATSTPALSGREIPAIPLEDILKNLDGGPR